MTAKRALIIDDDASNCAIWQLVLSERGYEVFSAETIEASLPYITEDISLYLVDYHLPDGYGSEVAQHIKQTFPHSLIVIASMDDDADVIRESMTVGGNLFIVKPAGPSVMNQILNEIDTGVLDSTAHQLINRNGRRSYAA